MYMRMFRCKCTDTDTDVSTYKCEQQYACEENRKCRDKYHCEHQYRYNYACRNMNISIILNIDKKDIHLDAIIQL